MSGRPTLAVIGLNGPLGKHLLQGAAEVFSFSYPVHAIMLDRSTFSDSDKIKYFQADLYDTDSLAEALAEVDVVINTASSFVSQSNLHQAMENAGVRLYFPVGYGSDTDTSEFKDLFSDGWASIEDVRARGIKTVRLKGSFFTEWVFDNLYVVNVDPSTQTYNRIDDGRYAVSFSSYRDVAYSLLSLAGIQPIESIPDTVKIAGDTTTVDYFVAVCEKYSGKQFTVSPTTAQEVLDTARKAVLRKNSAVVRQANPRAINPKGPGAVVQKTPFWDAYAKAIAAFVVEPSKPANFADSNDNAYVNHSRLFQWQTVEDVARQHLRSQ